MCFHKSLLLWQLIWIEATSDYYIKARKGAKLYLGLGSDLSASGFALHMIYYQFLRIFWTNFGQMTLTFRVGRSRSFENCIKSCRKVSTFDTTRFGTSFHRKTTKTSDIISDPIYSKAVTFDL